MSEGSQGFSFVSAAHSAGDPNLFRLAVEVARVITSKQPGRILDDAVSGCDADELQLCSAIPKLKSKAKVPQD